MIPTKLQEIINDFQNITNQEKLELLLEFSDELPELPAVFQEQKETMHQVVECQSPLFFALKKEDDATIRLFFSAPAEAPTTRGFASILATGLDGLTAAEIVALDSHIPYILGLDKTISPLRLRGMEAMIKRVKHAVQDL